MREVPATGFAGNVGHLSETTPGKPARRPRAVASLRQDEIDQMTAGRMSADHDPLNALLDDEQA